MDLSVLMAIARTGVTFAGGTLSTIFGRSLGPAGGFAP